VSKAVINPSLCTSCNICAEVCPGTFGEPSSDPGIPKLAPDFMCLDCGHCVAVCPTGAIAHRAFPAGTIRPVEDGGRVPTYEEVMSLLRTRRSVRVFRDRAVEKDVILKVLEGARFAPSATNTQSTEYVVVTDRGLLRQVAELTSAILSGSGGAGDPYAFVYGLIAEDMEKGRDPILRGAPALIVAHAFSRANYAGVNASVALQNAVLAASSLGLGTLWAGYVMSVCRRDERVPALLSIPDGHQVYGALALGYPKYEYRHWVERRPLRVTWL